MIWRVPLAGLVGALLTFALLWLWLPSDPPLMPSGSGSRLAVVLDRLGAIWTYHEPWSMRSINFREAASPRWLDSPLVQVGLWVAISSALWLAGSARLGWRQRLTVCLALLLLGWLVLDLHWQGRLFARLQETRAQYAGLHAGGDTSAALPEPEATLARLADAMRERIPETPTRVLLITADPGGYVPLRIRYHLLPLNVHPGMDHLPPADQFRAGDHLLLIQPPENIGYQAAEQWLVQGDTRLPAEQVLILPGLAALFRIP